MIRCQKKLTKFEHLVLKFFRSKNKNMNITIQFHKHGQQSPDWLKKINRFRHLHHRRLYRLH